MLAELPRKTCWSIAEHAGDSSPDGMQHPLNRARWNTDGVAADLHGFVAVHLGEPAGVLIVDESGDLKKGEHTVGVQRHRGSDRERPGRGLPHLCRSGRARVDRPRALSAPAAGPRTQSAGPRPGCLTRSSSPPNPRWPPR
ncbi:transposase [Pseudonocardia hierapolitana]|uniref:transposase n=1 Tax=Pseudonocardia hierapolitana TaxID=1128676 RepID=UPI003CCC6E20